MAPGPDSPDVNDLDQLGSGAWSPAGASGEAWTPAPDEPSPWLIAQEDRYETLALLGRGGMGEVQLARDRRLQRLVAIKSAHSQADARRLQQEAWLAAQLDHPGVVPVHDAGIGPDGRPWYAMQLIRGRSLEQILRGPVSSAERSALLQAVRDACEAVGAAHAKGIVHRDIKPANIMIGDDGQTRVTDWGLARPLADATGNALRSELDLSRHGPETRVGQLVGTPAYMSPEQALGDRVDARADVWSFGVVLYQVLAGHSPFQGDGASAVLRQVVGRRPAPLGTSVPAELRAVTFKALSQEPADRYEHAAELAQALTRALSVPAEPEPTRPWGWGVPIGLVGLGLGVALGVGGVQAFTPSAPMTAASPPAAPGTVAGDERDRRLALALAAQAQLAASRGDRPSSEMLAAEALEIAELPEARGVLAAFGVTPRPVPGAPQRAPACTASRLAPAGDALLCLTGEAAQIWSTEPVEMRWERPSDAIDGRFSADGSLVALSGTGRSSASFDVRSGALVAEWTWPIRPGPHLVGTTGHLAVQMTRAGVRVVDRRTQRDEEVDNLPDQLLAGALRPDDSLVRVLLGPDKRVELAVAERVVAELPDRGDDVAGIFSFTLDTTGRWAAFGTLRGSIGLVDLDTGQQSERLDPGVGPVVDVHASPDGRWVAVVGETSRGALVEAATGLVLTLPAGLRAMRWRDARTVMAFGDGLRAWTVPDRVSPAVYDVPGGVTSLAWSRHGDLAATVGEFGAIRWTAAGERAGPVGMTDTRMVYKSGAFSQDGDRFVLTGVLAEDPLVIETQGWRASTTALRSKSAGFTKRIGWLQGDLLVGIGYGLSPTVARLGQDPSRLLQIAGRGFVDLATAPDHASAALIDERGGIWRISGDPASISQVHTLEKTSSVAAGPAGEVVAGGLGQAWLVTAHDTVALDLSADAAVLDVAMSPDGRWIAAGLLTGGAVVWDRQGRRRAVLDGHAQRVSSVAFAPDSSVLATGGWDDRVHLWDLSVLDAPAASLVNGVRAAWSQAPDET